MKCALCSAALPSDDSPWGVYFDTCHEGNMCGGDTFETRAYLCADCGEKLQAQGGIEIKPEPVRYIPQATEEIAPTLEDVYEKTVDAVERYIDTHPSVRAWLDKQLHLSR